MDKKVLIADDEAIIRKVLKQELILAGYQVHLAVDGQQALSALNKERFCAAILDMRMPKQSGMQVLREIKDRQGMVIILITAHASITNAVEAIKLGADDYLTKPFENQELIDKLDKLILAKKKTIQQSPSFDQQNPISSKLIGNSEAMQSLLRKIHKIKDIDTTVLITGESGTGKSAIAKEIHQSSQRNDAAFIHVDCAGLPPNLIESELFGHEKGAFTSAFEQRKGKFEQAGTGTVFLDEIGCLPLQLQSKLLNVLQERQVFRIGGAKAYPIHARIIAATNEDLEEAVNNNTFREDLYYRLNVIRLECPPLRYRRDDIQLLAEYFIKIHCKKMHMQIASGDDHFWDCIKNYSWPGNVRELENVLEGMLALSEKNYLATEDLPLRIKSKSGVGWPVTSTKPALARRSYSLKDQEIQTIRMALRKHNGHRSKTAQDLGISRRTLQYKLKKMEEQGISLK